MPISFQSALERYLEVQLPKINELIDEILSSNCLYISTADLKSSFYQCSLAPESRPSLTLKARDGISVVPLWDYPHPLLI